MGQERYEISRNTVSAPEFLDFDFIGTELICCFKSVNYCLAREFFLFS
jgi:hypothetical protein